MSVDRVFENQFEHISTANVIMRTNNTYNKLVQPNELIYLSKSSENKLESLILAQNERWRRA